VAKHRTAKEQISVAELRVPPCINYVAQFDVEPLVTVPSKGSLYIMHSIITIVEPVPLARTLSVA